MVISFIIPVHNTDEGKLRRCFNSISGLSKVSYECVVVDDGSEESCALYCKALVLENPGFRYYRKENGGVSSARNYGMRIAKGDFVFFVDSDDEISADGIEEVCEEENLFESCDHIICDLIIPPKKQKRLHMLKKPGAIGFEDILYRMGEFRIMNGPCTKFTRREFLLKADILFNEEMVTAEDAVFQMDIAINQPRAAYRDIVVYKYYYSTKTAENRVLKYNRTYIENIIYYYQRFSDAIGMCGEVSKKSILTKNSLSNFIDEIYYTAMALASMNQLSADMKKALIHAYEYVSLEENLPLNKKTKFRYGLIANKRWRSLRVLSFVRKIYRGITGVK